MALWTWSLKRRSTVLFALCAILALTAAGASNGGGCLTSLAEAVVGPNNAAEGRAPMPFPQKVTIQRTSAFGDRGNVLIQVQLNAKQLSDKAKDGTRSFATLGRGDNTVFLRDDGLGGDATSGDGVFTARLCLLLGSHGSSQYLCSVTSSTDTNYTEPSWAIR